MIGYLFDPFVAPIHHQRKSAEKIQAGNFCSHWNQVRKTLLLIIEFYKIWWLLKKPFVLAGNPQSKSTCCPRGLVTTLVPSRSSRFVWLVHRTEATWWRSRDLKGATISWWLTSCCCGQVGKLLWWWAQKGRCRKTSWYQWLCWRYQRQGELASTPCRCR